MTMKRLDYGCGKSTKDGEKMRKGQMFLAGTIVLIVGMILLKNVIEIYDITEEKRHIETIIIDKQLKNIMHEYENIINIAKESCQNYLYNFSYYLKSEMYHRIKILYVFIDDMNVTVGNFLGERINLTINNVNFVLNDGEQASNLFSFANITLSYQYRNDNITEIIPIEPNKVFAFFDITVGDKSFVRAKYLYNRTY